MEDYYKGVPKEVHRAELCPENSAVKIATLRQQRDDLLAALEKIADYSLQKGYTWEAAYHLQRDIARAEIDKVKGSNNG